MTHRARTTRLSALASAAAAFMLSPAASAQCTAQWLEASPGIPGPNGEVDALAIYNGDLIVAGAFTNAGPPLPQPANHIAAWNGTAWTHLGPGLNNTVLALAVYHGQLFATGTFTSTGPPLPP